ncbi:MAG TPA: UDP-N-acetylmuramoyl-L-alanyl-D-glutamate--2,6-diaminopimelate ligase [Anaerolineaceae bacterium]
MVGFVQHSLADLFAAIPVHPEGVVPALPVTGIVFDSRAVKPGNLFVALAGGNADGHRFIGEAARRGAVAAVGTQAIADAPIPYIRVADSRTALGYLSAAFYDYPARQLTMIGVTGTDGKTTTANLIYQILMAAGLRVGIISTVNATIGSEVLDTGFHVTTPEAPDVQRYLARMVNAGLTHVVLEATSHGLDQQRVLGCEFDLGVVTNITHEHLDYHGSYAAYREAKGKLVARLGETTNKAQGNPRTAVLNRDDSSYDYLNDLTTVRKITYSQSSAADVWADEIEVWPAGIRFTAHVDKRQIPIVCNLVGRYNVSNCLAAVAATAGGLGMTAESVRQGIAALPGVPGRMEAIDLGQDFSAIVDFAHTPNALKRALETAHEICAGRVIAVFGSAGLRDREKRRLMAEVSAELADVTILTAEDPRTESLAGILAEMAAGIEAKGGVEGKTFWRVPDRREALRQAVRMAKAGDMVIACGKGHEQSMCFGETEYAWDDRTALRAALGEFLGVPGEEMPGLPDVG